MEGKQLIVVGGPNGAGKTTFVEAYLRDHPCPYLGADRIALELAPDDLESAAVAAGREFVHRLAAQLDQDESFIVETTLSGKSFARTLEQASARGFWTKLHFVFPEGPDSSVVRVQERVRRGGHDVPEADIRRRFARSIANFWTLYRPLVDEWVLTYNGMYQSVQVAQGDIAGTTVFDRQLLQQFWSLGGLDPNDS